MAIRSNHRIIGILAPVDSGKTTLAEALLFEGGALRQKGRVDHRDSFLDTGTMERRRGITIFSKIARLAGHDTSLILLDTPGHQDFGPETERVLAVLDYCILVVNGADGVTAQTRRLWGLLEAYRVPVFLFINKTDQAGVDPDRILNQLRTQLSDHIQEFSGNVTRSEEVSLAWEPLLEEYLKAGQLEPDTIQEAIVRRTLFPCYAGSALKGAGVTQFLEGLFDWTRSRDYPDTFSARVYKISRDETGQRLTHVKVTGGRLRNKSLIGEDKINELRRYTGTGYESVQTAVAGDIVALAGLRSTRAGQVLGEGEEEIEPTVFPVLSYRLRPVNEADRARLTALVKELGEELPDLDVLVDSEGYPLVHIMGEILLEVLLELIRERGDLEVSVDEGSIIYRETITQPVVGIGHFEPLRHYAEVHLLLEPSAAPGIRVQSRLDVSRLAVNRQQQVLYWLRSREHPGVLTGASLSHLSITLVAGRDHDKHTQGGDFREATGRALRHGLLQARALGACRLLEPFYRFRILTAQSFVGRILTDLDRLGAKDLLTQPAEEGMELSGMGPVATLRSYFRELSALTRGEARLSYDIHGYEPCHDEASVVAAAAYDPEQDALAPGGSVFCTGGAGVLVPWDQVAAMAHLEPMILEPAKDSPVATVRQSDSGPIGSEEIDQILSRTFYANANEKKQWKKARKADRVETVRLPRQEARTGPDYLLIDGYNVIHAWPELAELANVNFDAAREKLIEILKDHGGFTAERIEVVFDAWKVTGGSGSQIDDEGVTVVFTRENETADRWIERRSGELARRHPVRVVTSDQAEQMMAAGSGALVFSARRFRQIVTEVRDAAMAEHQRRSGPQIPYRPLQNVLSEENSLKREDK